MPEPTELADWKAKTDAATEGPWEAFEQDDAFAIEARTEDDFGFFVVEPPLYQPDAEFIATARTAMPRLLSAVENVLALHTPTYPAEGPDVACFHCAVPATTGKYTWVAWPCPTVKAITDALGGGDDAE